MPVHPASVIEPWLLEVDPAFYDSITTKENYSYFFDDQSYWTTQFSNLMSVLNSWKNISREIEQHFIQIFQHYSTTQQFIALNLPEPLISSDISALSFFDAGGFRSVTLTRPTDYYDDKPVGLDDSTKMLADIAQIQTASDQEQSIKDSVMNKVIKNSARIVYLSLVSSPDVTAIHKETITQVLFKDNFWEVYNTVFQLGLIIPEN